MELINKQYALASAISGFVRTDENGEKWIRTKDVRESIMNTPTVEAIPKEDYMALRIASQIFVGGWVRLKSGSIQ